MAKLYKIIIWQLLLIEVNTVTVEEEINSLKERVQQLEDDVFDIKAIIDAIHDTTEQGDDRDCYCIASNVNVRDDACGNVMKTHGPGACFRATGKTRSCQLGSSTYLFVELDYNNKGTSGWVAEGYITADEQSKCSGLGEPTVVADFVSRSQWEARYPSSSTALNTPLSMVFIHHSAGSQCITKTSCVSVVQAIQNYHMDIKHWDDIGYSFLIGQDGNIYEGRGWDNQGAHTSGYNDQAYGICIMGNFETDTPTPEALSAIKTITKEGVDMGALTPGFELFGHKQAVCTTCPGTNLYTEIQNWNYYSSRLNDKCP